MVSIIVVSLLCIWFYPSVQDYMESNNMWNGIKDFQSEFNAVNIDSLVDIAEPAQGGVLIAIPYLPYADQDLSRIKQFVDAGGVLMVMDDYGYGNSILARFGDNIRFSNKPLLDPLFSFKNQWLPRITDFSPEVKAAGVNVLMLNHATALTITGEVNVAAWSSRASFLDLDENESKGEQEPAGPFPIAASFVCGRGKVIAVSDPSSLINSMVGRDDNHAFWKYLMGNNADKATIMIDRSHLGQTPLDVSKTRLAGARAVIAGPYGQLGIIALIFIVLSRYMLKKGQTLV